MSIYMYIMRYVAQPCSDASSFVWWTVSSVMPFVSRFSSEVRPSSWSGPNGRARERRRSAWGDFNCRNSKTWNWPSPSAEPKCPEHEDTQHLENRDQWRAIIYSFTKYWRTSRRSYEWGLCARQVFIHARRQYRNTYQQSWFCKADLIPSALHLTDLLITIRFIHQRNCSLN